MEGARRRLHFAEWETMNGWVDDETNRWQIVQVCPTLSNR